jgi:SAM-dependent methyltransferase
MNVVMQNQRVLWDRVLVDLSERDRDPEPELGAFLALGPERIGGDGLDIGCGLGRHTLAALRAGYRMAAVDFSEVAVQRTKEIVRGEGFAADVRCASMHELPFLDETFDFCFSWCVLNHGRRETFEKAIDEAVRVLRPGGVLFGFVMGQGDSRFGAGDQLGEDCFVFVDGPEKGVCHYFPSEGVLVRALERSTRIESLREVVWEGEENQFYHPEMEHSSHFAFLARKA